MSVAEKGHNRTLNKTRSEVLKSFVDRVTRLDEEIAALKADQKDLFAQCKAGGFSPKIIRMVVNIMKRDRGEVEDEVNLLDTYLHALGAGPLFSVNGEYDSESDGEDADGSE